MKHSCFVVVCCFPILVISCLNMSAQCPLTNITDSSLVPALSMNTAKEGDKVLTGELTPPFTAADISFVVCDGNKTLTFTNPALSANGKLIITLDTALASATHLVVQARLKRDSGFAYGIPASISGNLADTQYVFIGGVEQSGYSSLGLSTDPFVQIYIEGPQKLKKNILFDAWGRIRLLGAPQPSTNGIASTFTDPTGTITKLDFTKVGQSIDIVGGTQIFLNKQNATFDQSSFVVWAGTTTPLSSQNIAYTFKSPAVNTLECQQLLIRFTPSTGYNPGLVADPSGKSCLTNSGTAVTDIAFANQDRTSFLFKWGAGLRTQGTLGCKTSRPDCIGALALVDATIGQDAAVTRGLVRHFVAKADGILPIPTGNTSYVYLFGSVYTRLNRNHNSSPLILAAETTQPTLPNPAVVVLPLVQPDRDFFRLGVGLNLKQIFQKLFSTNTPDTNGAKQ